MIQLLLLVFLLIHCPCSSSFAEDDTIEKAAPVTKTAPEEDASGEVSKKVAKGREITLRDFGSDDLGFISLPMEAPLYGVLIIPDGYGLTDQVKAFCDTLASQRAIALAVDLFNGKVATNADDAAQMQKDLRDESAKRIVAAGLCLLTESPRLKADKVVVATFGRQFNLVLSPDKKVEEKIVGATWFEPEGTFDGRLFRKSTLPIQIVSSRLSVPQSDFIKALEKNVIPERQKITFVDLHMAPLGFVLSGKALKEQMTARTQAMDFWEKCAKGAYVKERNIFQKFIDSIVD